jgi:hypothetical protein
MVLYLLKLKGYYINNRVIPFGQQYVFIPYIEMLTGFFGPAITRNAW